MDKYLKLPFAKPALDFPDLLLLSLAFSHSLSTLFASGLVTVPAFCVGKSFQISFGMDLLGFGSLKIARVPAFSLDFWILWDGISGAGNVTLSTQRVQQ